MAFFGLTRLGYQNPIGDRMIINPRGVSLLPDIATESSDDVRGGTPPTLQELQGPADTPKADLLPYSSSSDILEGSQEKCKEMFKKTRAIKSPNQLYTTPLTDNQQYGWMVTGSPEPWTQVRRFPRRFSEMTKFVNEMSSTHRTFSLF